MINIPAGTYEQLAAEYYDESRHPTSANFREASAQFFESKLGILPITQGQICEVGTGKSLIAELLSKFNLPLDNLLLIDSSPSMLRYSVRWAEVGAQMIVADAENLPLQSESLTLLFSSLGDPYNVDPFWREVYRVLSSDGLCLYTTPAYDWASAFRGGNTSVMSAEFELRDGSHLLVPSWIYPVNQQVTIIEHSGLKVEEIVQVPLAHLKSAYLSPKLLVRDGPERNVVTGYLMRKA